MTEHLDWRALPDDYEWPSEGEAEIALGLPQSTIASWRGTGRIPPKPATTAATARWQGKFHPRPIVLGELREALLSYRRMSPRAGAFSENDWDLISVAVQTYAIDATRADRKRCEALLARIQHRDDGHAEGGTHVRTTPPVADRQPGPAGDAATLPAPPVPAADLADAAAPPRRDRPDPLAPLGGHA